MHSSLEFQKILLDCFWVGSEKPQVHRWVKFSFHLSCAHKYSKSLCNKEPDQKNNLMMMNYDVSISHGSHIGLLFWFPSGSQEPSLPSLVLSLVLGTKSSRANLPHVTILNPLTKTLTCSKTSSFWGLQWCFPWTTTPSCQCQSWMTL